MFVKRSLIFLVFLMLVVGAAAQDMPPADLTFFMTFVPNVQFAPVYVALEKGYFADAGINLIIEHGDEPLGVELIAAGERQFGLISGEEVIKARANGRPVVYVYEWFQKYPVGIAVPVDYNIESVADLAGRKVGIPGRFGASYNGLVALLTANDMQESDIQLEAIGFIAPEMVCLGYETNGAQGVEASVVYINNEPLQIAARCTPVQVFPVSQAADLVSNGIITNEQTIAENPALVQAVVSGFDSGLRDAINNPAEAYLLSSMYVENLPLDDAFRSALESAAAAQSAFLETSPEPDAIRESRAALLENLSAKFEDETLVQFQVLLNTIELWDADQLGLSELTSWEITQDTLVSMGFVTTPTDLEAAFTNDFLVTDESS